MNPGTESDPLSSEDVLMAHHHAPCCPICPNARRHSGAVADYHLFPSPHRDVLETERVDAVATKTGRPLLKKKKKYRHTSDYVMVRSVHLVVAPPLSRLEAVVRYESWSPNSWNCEKKTLYAHADRIVRLEQNGADCLLGAPYTHRYHGSNSETGIVETHLCGAKTKDPN